jgi:hypothetical protein
MNATPRLNGLAKGVSTTIFAAGTDVGSGGTAPGPSTSVVD